MARDKTSIKTKLVGSLIELSEINIIALIKTHCINIKTMIINDINNE